MKVVCLKSEWKLRDGRRPKYPTPVEKEMYNVLFVEEYDGNKYYCLEELGRGLWNTDGFRFADNSFGYWKCGQIEQQIQIEIAEGL